MKKSLFTLCLVVLSSCIYAQKNDSKEIFYLIDESGEEWLNFIGYDNRSPVFYKYKSPQSLYCLKQYSSDSLFLEHHKEARFGSDKEAHLLWVNDDMEIYTMRKVNSVHDENLIITTNNRIDTVNFKFDSFYEDDVQPVVLIAGDSTLLITQPSGYQDENLGWYYGSILKVDLTKKPLIVERLPIMGIQMQRVEDFLYYKGGSGQFENAILRVKIGMWNKIDTLVIHSGFWVVNSDILYVETGGYKGQDSWLKDPMGRTKFLACSIPNMKCAIISNKVPYRQLIIFNNQYYRLFSQGIIKMKLPKVLEFPYKQTIPR